MTSKIPETQFSLVHLFEEYPVLVLPERLTVLEAVQFKEIFQELLQQNQQYKKITLDFGATTFIDSSGVGALVHNFKAAQAQGIELLLDRVNPPIMGVLAITGLDKLLAIQPAQSFSEEGKPNNADSDLPETHPSVKSWLKRLIDIAGAIVGLGITAVLFLPIALAIKVNSNGPILFSQTRCGWLGREFKILKFRSMCVDAEALKNTIPNQADGAIFKNTNDPRITAVGRFLRKTSLDELPQFWNVLKGEMSLVGTRPPTKDEVDRYDVPQWRRLNVKPGMTGEWQVNGRSQVRSFEDVIKLDLRYQENWSLGYDLQLIVKTILVLFRKNSGAY
ncbi:MAG: hypothetical protein N5P05_003361 [Chroococcopsis gigantea SAG 12.99]|jgi:anti-anti-sigma factor|nr:sugar transferase [Chlorogloea purpurea SAG 13.99]MDV3001755.1 hypothetical protein [Chroococcopsis gigantea SAG 12.99]